MTDPFDDAVTRMQARDSTHVVVTHFTNGQRLATVRPALRSAKGVLADCTAAGVLLREFGRLTAATHEGPGMVVVMTVVDDLDMAAAVCAAALDMPDLADRLADIGEFYSQAANSDLVTDLCSRGFDRLVEGVFGEPLAAPPEAWTAARLLLDEPSRVRSRSEIADSDLEARTKQMALRLTLCSDVLVTARLLERDSVQVRPAPPRPERRGR